VTEERAVSGDARQQRARHTNPAESARSSRTLFAQGERSYFMVGNGFDDERRVCIQQNLGRDWELFQIGGLSYALCSVDVLYIQTTIAYRDNICFIFHVVTVH